MCRSSKNPISVYLQLTLVCSAAVWVLIIWSGHLNMGYGLVIPAIMWCPALASLFTSRLLGRELSSLGWRWPQSKYLAAAYFVPLAYASVAYGAVWALQLGGWNSEFVGLVADGLGLKGFPTWASFTLAIICMATGGVIQNVSMTLGEEIGWRGFLVPELAKRMSYTKTSLLSGLIWAAWHSPLLLFADYNVGTNRWYALGCFSFTCISMSFILAWFSLKSESLWPAVLFHASHNVFFPVVFDNLTWNTGHTLMYTTVFGAAPACTSALFALYFWSRRGEVEQAFNKGLGLESRPLRWLRPRELSMRNLIRLASRIAVLVVSLSPLSAGQQSDIQNLVNSDKLEGLRWPNFSDYRASLQKFYEPTGYAPAWVREAQPVPQALSLIETFRNAGKKGLDPEDYDASRWEERIRDLQGLSKGLAVARFDVALTLCTMRYVSDLRIGRINPQHFDFGLRVEGKKYDLAQFLHDRILTTSDLQTVLDELEPPFAGYRRTEQALAHYLELARADDGQKLPTVTQPIEPGQPYMGVPRLVSFLRLVGDLPADATLLGDSRTYSGPLVDAVKRFQRRHGLEADGRLGPATIKQLNVPIQDRVLQLQLTLERWRWLPAEFSAPPIIVNIPDFRLRALDENNKVVMDMRVVVGKAMRTQTPVFTRDMTYIVLRPYWNVPPSILRGEIVPAIQRDRSYIARKNYEVTTQDGKEVTSGEISDEVLAQLRARKLAVRQKPGPSNALGLVKLIFPNEHNVYLHSTPSQSAFSRSRRDFSHGCIRVEQPAELAAWALRNNPGWTLERVQQGMQNGKDDVTVNLAQRVPVFIVYGTALAYENGEVHFSDDIYGHDGKLAAALAKGYPYP